MSFRFVQIKTKTACGGNVYGIVTWSDVVAGVLSRLSFNNNMRRFLRISHSGECKIPSISIFHFMANHDILKHINFLRQSLSQDKKPLGFFLSAGCPLSVDVDPWPLIPDVRKLTMDINDELCAKNGEDPNRYDRLLNELSNAGKNPQNIEDILSFIRAMYNVAVGGIVRGFSADELAEIDSEVCALIVTALKKDLPNSETPYHKLSAWISSIDRHRPIELFTTNYDLLLEQALEETSVPYFDGFVGGRYPFFEIRTIEDDLVPVHWTRLWKIHGSINWIRKADGDIYRCTLNDGIAGSHLIFPSHLKYEQSRKMPYLVLIDQLTKFLKQPQAILILCGYSFNDDHLNSTIISALKANPTAMVIGMMFGKMSTEVDGVLNDTYANAMKLPRRHNLALWCFDEAIIGTVRAKWFLGRPLENHENPGGCIQPIIHAALNDDGEPSGESKTVGYEVKLGDFAVMGRFLQELIGNHQFEGDEN